MAVVAWRMPLWSPPASELHNSPRPLSLPNQLYVSVVAGGETTTWLSLYN
jgi:hypothetical protein